MKNQFISIMLFAGLLPAASRAQSLVDGVVAAEDAFAAQSKQAGTAAAFLANGAPAAFVTEGGKLASAQEVWKSRPAQPNARLTWHPALVDVAQSGELGYTTGPWTMLESDKPGAAGEYVTVWRKQPDGVWKFAVDLGIERIGTAPARAAFVLQPHLLAAPATPTRAPANLVLDVDKKFAKAEAAKPGPAYQQSLSAEARLYRPGLSVMQGAAAAANMKSLDRAYEFTATTGYLAASGDLGYVVGALHRTGAGAKQPEENGSYLRIWRREEVAGWRIVLEILNLAPNPTANAGEASGPPAGKLPSQRPQ